MSVLVSRFSVARRTPAPAPTDTRTSVIMNETLDNGTSGSIVAFEGHPDIISTQLRLLPASPQILILPSVNCYLPTDNGEQHDEAHEYIRKAHGAVMTRNKTARAFLQGSNPSDRRLVFMNGGTPSAQALCIRHIMRHETQGDDVEAEAMFNFLVKEGLGGLKSQAKRWTERGAAAGKQTVDEEGTGSYSSMSPRTVPRGHYEPPHILGPQHQQQLGGLDEDPIWRAMRAAEALDRQTASLQPSNELDLTLGHRPRSASLPMYSYSDNFGDAAPFLVFGAPRRANSVASIEEAAEEVPISPITPRFFITHYDEQSLDQPVLAGFNDPELSPSCVGETYGPTFLHSPIVDTLPTAKSERFPARSPGDVVFGEASMIDMRLSTNQGPVTRVRSLDRMYPSGPKYRDLCIPSSVVEADAEGTRRPLSCMVVPDKQDPSSSRLDLVERPRTILVRPTQANIVSLAPVPAEKKRKSIRLAYVDRGTDAAVPMGRPEPFAPVLPVAEDLVVYFKDEVPDAILDTVVKSFRDRSYPVLSNSPDGSEADTVNDQLPSTPRSQSIRDADMMSKASERHELTLASPPVVVDEYDPFAYVQSSWPPPKPVKSVPPPMMKVERPPTPEKTPVPSVSDGRDGKFHEFKIASDQTAVAIQNSLRSILGVYFPPGTQGFSQFSFALLPELEGLWKPIFRESEPGSPRANDRRMDQILAVGSQRGVKKEYSSAILGQLDKLGGKRSGMSRSGRLDFRYLLANAIQAYTAQPLTNQASDNPFNNPYFLATLIIPHLETYLALHSEVRYLLLEYPPEHISTILALQRLVGVDLMKVAQIVDSKSSDMGRFTHIRGASANKETRSPSPLGKPVGGSTGDSSDVTVSKANFLLTSSASDSEIATFIDTVRKILMGVSKFYTPEEPVQPPSPPTKMAPKSKPPSLSGNFSAFPNTASALSPTSPSRTGTLMQHGLSSPAPSRPASIAETVRSYRTTRTGRSAKRSKSRRAYATADGESIMTFDPAEDSDYDMEERRLMPMFMQKPSKMQKPNSRKALKFLGLA